MKKVIEIAREAGFETDMFGRGIWDAPEINRFADLVRYDEREVCAYLRKEIPLIGKCSIEYENGFWDALDLYEQAIRARSEE